MADINVQRKERSILPWILGLVVLAVLAWVLLSVLGSDDGAGTGEPAVQTEETVGGRAP